MQVQFRCCCFFFFIEKDNIVQLHLKSTLSEASKGKKVGSTVVNTCGLARNPRMESTKSKMHISRNRKKTTSHTRVATRKSNILLQASEGLRRVVAPELTHVDPRRKAPTESTTFKTRVRTRKPKTSQICCERPRKG